MSPAAADIAEAPMAAPDWQDTIDARLALQVAEAATERARRAALEGTGDGYAEALAALRAQYGRSTGAGRGALPPLDGVILWEGVSRYDGARIVCIATDLSGGSNNEKTGGEVQTWIMRVDIAPHDATHTGADVSVCGRCPYRPILAGYGQRCYVQTFNAPLSVWRAYRAGRYRMWDGVTRPSAPVRAGSYGDPALVPADVWARFGVATGYSHAWREPWAQDHRAWLMASVDGPGDLAAARALGWRSYQVRAPDASTPVDGSVECPSPRVACADCRLCGGLQRDARDVWIRAHGQNATTTHGRPSIPSLDDAPRHHRLRVVDWQTIGQSRA